MIDGSLLTPLNILFVIGLIILVYLMVNFIKLYKESPSLENTLFYDCEIVTHEDPNHETHEVLWSKNDIIEAMKTYIDSFDNVEEIVFHRAYRIVFIKTNGVYEYFYYGFLPFDMDMTIIAAITRTYGAKYRIVHDFTSNNYGNGRCVTLEEEII